MRKNWKKRTGILVLALAVVGIGAVVFFILKQSYGSHEDQEAQASRKMYVCSMEPQIIRDEPGSCPICGMDLIEKKEFDHNYADFRLNDVVMPVNEAVLSSVQTVSPFEEELPLIIEASGIINFDSRMVTTVSAHFRGLIEKSYIKYKFQPVRKGQKIYDIYCPEIYSTHMNYVNLLKKFPDNPDVTYEARAWLVNIGLTDEQIRNLITDEKPELHLSVYSEADGFVVGPDFAPEVDLPSEGNLNTLAGAPPTGSNFGIGMSEGAIVEAGTPLFKVVSLGSVRADLKVRNEDAGLLRTGQKVILTDAVTPGRKLNATITQIEPLNGSLFQLVKVYITDKEKTLVPGMKIQGYIEAGSKKTLWISKSAIADLGRQQAVFLLKDSIFVASSVKTGLRAGDRVEICAGIDQNSRVALNASLLTDSDGFIKTRSDETNTE